MSTETTDAHAAEPEVVVAPVAAAAAAPVTKATPAQKMKPRKPNHRFGIPETQPDVVK
jgi:hypothetical protein